MRPGQLRPGDTAPRIGRTRWPRSFNEAGAASPRRSVSGHSRLRKRQPRFNEAAGQLRPGDPALGDDGPDAEAVASMRPGQLRPGDAQRRRKHWTSL